MVCLRMVLPAPAEHHAAARRFPVEVVSSDPAERISAGRWETAGSPCCGCSRCSRPSFNSIIVGFGILFNSAFEAWGLYRTVCIERERPFSREFLLDYMVIDPRNNYLVTGPSISPENSFRYQGQEFCASMMPTCDRVLAYEIFSACLQSTEILNVDASFADSLRTAISKLPPFRISANRGVQEWFEDYEEAHPNHRHTTHLLSLYPYSQITLNKTPELAKAAYTTIERRLAAKDWEDTEWSRANMICFYARLKEPKKAYDSVKQLLGPLSRENMFTVSPAGIAGANDDIFAFDGNTAGAAGIAEMLLQSYDNRIELLPCLPEEWKDGSFKGLCARGGIELDANWKNARIENTELRASVPAEFSFRITNASAYNWKMNKKAFTPEINADGSVQISMNAGDKLTVSL